ISPVAAEENGRMGWAGARDGGQRESLSMPSLAVSITETAMLAVHGVRQASVASRAVVQAFGVVGRVRSRGRPLAKWRSACEILAG
ncbi:hypothetical protein TorRG33x02_107990, partial [Trema orientale]